jgi:chromosome partitioning protein
MRAIVFASQKGGTGKSTLAIGLAVVAIEDGERVSILETDPQGTISYWSSRRNNPEPAVELTSRFRLESALRDLKQKRYTLVIIDTPGSDSDVVTEAIRLADLCLIPARPSQADIEAACPTLKAAHKFDRKFAFVLNQAPVRGRRPPLAAAALSEAGMLALPYIGMRNDHMDSLATGLGVSEFASNGIAAAEVRTLWVWVKQILTGKAQVAKIATELAGDSATQNARYTESTMRSSSTSV